jgi:PHD/YefM family antitoxin component YafN of YafNO toxin-antitoxin module
MSEWESLQETLAVLSSEALRKDLAEAARAEASGQLTDQDEMAALMEERLKRG